MMMAAPADVVALCGLEPVPPARGRDAVAAGPPPRPLRGPARLVLRGVGSAAAGLGLLGVFVPLLPTTPFLLVASWAFLRASPALARALDEHRLLGPYLRAWRERQAIPRPVKMLGLASIAASGLGLHALAGPGWHVTVAGWTLIAAAGYVGSRPSR